MQSLSYLIQFSLQSEAEKKEKYDVLRRISNGLWSHLLENLSKQGEWKLIKELVLGLDNNTGNASNTENIVLNINYWIQLFLTIYINFSSRKVLNPYTCNL